MRERAREAMTHGGTRSAGTRGGLGVLGGPDHWGAGDVMGAGGPRGRCRGRGVQLLAQARPTDRELGLVAVGVGEAQQGPAHSTTGRKGSESWHRGQGRSRHHRAPASWGGSRGVRGAQAQHSQLILNSAGTSVFSATTVFSTHLSSSLKEGCVSRLPAGPSGDRTEPAGAGAGGNKPGSGRPQAALSVTSKSRQVTGWDRAAP